MKHSLRAFRHRNYRLFFFGQSLSVIGSWTQQIAMSWLVYRLSGSAWLLGVTGFAGQIAILLFAPFGGIWADRLDRRRLLIVTQGLAMLQGFALAGLTYAGLVEVWHVIVMATLLGIVMAFDTPVRQSFTSEMVPSKQDLPSAIAFNAAMQNGGRMIGPTIAGILLTVSSEAFCFLVNGVSKLAVIASLAMMAVVPYAGSPTKARIWASFKEGVTYAWDLVPVRLLLPLIALTSFMVTPYLTLMPIFAAEVFTGGAHTLGFLISGAGLGGIVGMIYLASRRDVRGLARWVAFAAALAGAAIIGFAYSRRLPLSLFLITVTGFGIIVMANSTSQILQTIVDDDKRGRVMSFFVMAFLGMQPVGSLAAGALASWVGATHTLALGGVCTIIGAYMLWRKLPLLRRHIRPIYLRLGIIPEQAGP
ncbi:MAG: MFS transporter [Burkholderiales bacterium]|nr:MFS transporter [Burkholderiales bacterium]